MPFFNLALSPFTLCPPESPKSLTPLFFALILSYIDNVFPFFPSQFFLKALNTSLINAATYTVHMMAHLSPPLFLTTQAKTSAYYF